MSLLHATTAPSSAPVFRDISADDEEQQPHEIESLCMNCYKNGMTRLLLTKVPFFREIIVSSFNCDSCNWSNTEIQSAGRIQDQGVRYSLSVRSKRDVDREVVKTDYATMRIPEIDFEIPACTQKGALTTIEGILERTIVGLQQEQPHRRAENAQVAEKIDVFITKLKSLKDGETPFTCIIDDPSGNSFVENPFAPQKDEALTVTHYRRSQEQDSLLGIESVDGQKNTEEKPEDLKDEVLQFHTNCPECNAPAATNMKLVQIPHFKEVIIMATNCDACGHRTNEVKSGGAIEPLGTRITLHITDPSDLTRDVLKVVDKNPFTLGDSSTSDRKEKLQEFGRKIDQILEGQIKVHFVLEDSAGNSYLQNVYAPEEDPEMKVEKYERSFEQNEDLGLNDMKTEGYEEHEPSSC
ncbi:zinc finger protein ZPR1 isoform X2 [Hyla sarda]|uniref:zinc finger protein ZPR1 isoform X2 n=1 Tax=Hyla sarda TaxID=327740 RepID=UPI0024C30BB4|nr:zinc finger protein ZPR1 isoform X2 [Hyla sarda]